MIFDLAPCSCGVSCQCGQMFANVMHFVKHAKRCNELQQKIKADPQLQAVYESLLLLKEGTLSA